jgi:hypothetical protein
MMLLQEVSIGYEVVNRETRVNAETRKDREFVAILNVTSGWVFMILCVNLSPSQLPVRKVPEVVEVLYHV